jgi:hypothetical protein
MTNLALRPHDHGILRRHSSLAGVSVIINRSVWPGFRKLSAMGEPAAHAQFEFVGDESLVKGGLSK